MNGCGIDALARAIGIARSRRGVIKACASVAVGLVSTRLTQQEASAGCGGGCGPGKCCRKGKCRPTCGAKCCGDCFAPIEGTTGEPNPELQFCCRGGTGSVCDGAKKTPGDDRCCYPDETCVNGKCCCDGCMGATRCGGECCPLAACCDGECCGTGKVCVRKTPGKPKVCVSANRDCGHEGDCYEGESCVGGRCCAGGRICQSPLGTPICCNAGEYCELPPPGPMRCSPVNTIQNTYRARRVRV